MFDWQVLPTPLTTPVRCRFHPPPRVLAGPPLPGPSFCHRNSASRLIRSVPFLGRYLRIGWSDRCEFWTEYSLYHLLRFVLLRCLHPRTYHWANLQNTRFLSLLSCCQPLGTALCYFGSPATYRLLRTASFLPRGPDINPEALYQPRDDPPSCPDCREPTPVVNF